MSLGGETRIRLTLENSLKEMPVVIPTAVVVQPRVSDLWGQAEAQLPKRDGQGDGTAIVLKPGARETLTLVVRPQTLRAVETSLVPIESDKAHSHLDLEIPSPTRCSATARALARADVPVRFRPGVLTLLAALIIGVLLGSARFRCSRRSAGRWPAGCARRPPARRSESSSGWSASSWSPTTASSSSSASTVDPWQTLPTLLLGIGNGLGGLQGRGVAEIHSTEIG